MNLIEIERWLTSHGYTEKRGRWVSPRIGGVTFSYVINTSSLRLDRREDKGKWERVASKQFAGLRIDEYGRLLGFNDAPLDRK